MCGASIDLGTEHPADPIFNPERNAQSLSSSPDTDDTGQLRNVLATSLTRRPLACPGTQSGMHRNASAASPDPGRSSLYGPSDFGDQGQSSIVPKSVVERDESTTGI